MVSVSSGLKQLTSLFVIRFTNHNHITSNSLNEDYVFCLLFSFPTDELLVTSLCYLCNFSVTEMLHDINLWSSGVCNEARNTSGRTAIILSKLIFKTIYLISCFNECTTCTQYLTTGILFPNERRYFRIWICYLRV